MTNTLRKLIEESVKESLAESSDIISINPHVLSEASRLDSIAARAHSRGYGLVVSKDSSGTWYTIVDIPSFEREMSDPSKDESDQHGVLIDCILGSVSIMPRRRTNLGFFPTSVKLMGGFLAPLALALAMQIDKNPIAPDWDLSNASVHMLDNIMKYDDRIVLDDNLGEPQYTLDAPSLNVDEFLARGDEFRLKHDIDEDELADVSKLSFNRSYRDKERKDRQTPVTESSDPKQSRLVPIAKRALNRGYALVTATARGMGSYQYSGIFDPSMLQNAPSLDDIKAACLGSVCLSLKNDSLAVVTIAGFLGPLALVLASQLDGRPIEDSSDMSPAAVRMAAGSSDTATRMPPTSERLTADGGALYELYDMDLGAAEFDDRGNELIMSVARQRRQTISFVDRLFSNAMNGHFNDWYEDVERKSH